MSELKTTIPKGSLVLVTGVTGFVASQVAKQFLERGYKVRGTVRDIGKAAWLVEDVLKSYIDEGAFELALVPDIAADHALDEAVKGVSAVVHLATIGTFDPDPNKVIPQTVAGTMSALEAAMKEPSVLQFVYTSSKGAALIPSVGDATNIGRDTWNDKAVHLAWAPPPYEPSRGMLVYFASKVAAEKAVWKFVEERKPHFTVNVISPAGIIGEPLNKKQPGFTASWIPQLYEGRTTYLDTSVSIYFVDVKDVALLHVAAVLDPEVKNARFHIWGQHSSWSDIAVIMRKLRPDHESIPEFPTPEYLTISTDQSETLALLKHWGDHDGWRPLEKTVADNLSVCK
ncbi:NAD-dependent epimerase/dehydratase [Lachnellula hyalina]|uniref:NAD-dependent epimerase/dehydratase n=1 Tax=Lachnellula hyalina TaxID=1316788 RepID=A0A8H8R035_9HELO|nr:NAD-dependent epimerase/dehydratase [Lachnellula hyalina]TVY25221.1 NAD-dependent epimerase/dehydratase [Lachnellula hyalina]